MSDPDPVSNVTDGTDAPVRCAVCEATHTEPYVEKNGYAFRRCPACGYVFCHPRPTAEELALHYGGGADAPDLLGDGFPKAASRRRRGFVNALKLIRHVWGKRVLDLGCGGGFVTGGMKAAGAREAVGLDIDPGAVAYARAHYPRCTFCEGAFDTLDPVDLGRFDFVYSSEVIEHVLDVEGYMRFLAAVTRPGAGVFITTPDIASPQVPADVTRWPVFDPPTHIQFFTEATLTRLFGRFGFDAVKRVPDPGGAGLKAHFRKTA